MSKKGAYSSGGGAARRRGKDQAMAAMLKANNVKRTSQRCPICYGITGIEGAFEHHIQTHK